MSALAEAGDYAPASLYTYFPSRSALVAALQHEALVVLERVGAQAARRWDAEIAGAGPGAEVAALARLCAFSDLFLTAPQHHRREFRLQQQLLVSSGIEEVADAGSVVPAAMAVLDLPRRLLDAAVDQGALNGGDAQTDPTGQPLDTALARTLTWVVAMNGALLVDGLVTGLPTTGVALGHQVSDTMLTGWGASPPLLREARSLTAGWRSASGSNGSELS